MDIPRRTIALALTSGLLAAGLVGGCSTDKLAERGLEKALEAGASGDAKVDIDSDTGSVKVEGEDGSFSMGSGELPDSFPSDVPLPDGDFQVVSAMEVAGEDGFTMVTLMVPGATVDGLLDYLHSGLVGAGYEQVGSYEQSADGDRAVSRQYSGSGRAVNLSVLGSDDGEVTVSYNIQAGQEE